MSAGEPGNQPPLVRLMARWHGLLGGALIPEPRPLLRLESGAALIAGGRAQRVDQTLAIVLPAVADLLFSLPGSYTASSVRPKIRLAVRVDASGLIVSVHYYGELPDKGLLERLRGQLADKGSLLVKRTDRGEVRLLAVLSEPPRPLSVVTVLAGACRVALPMIYVKRALPFADGGSAATKGDDVPSLAQCLGVSSSYVGAGRAALLMLAAKRTEQPVQVDAIEGHGDYPVLLAGPLLAQIPWLLGVIAQGEAAPLLVVHPGRLLKTRGLSAT